MGIPLYSKTTFEGGRGGVSSKPIGPKGSSALKEIMESHLVICLYHNGIVRILKDRFDDEHTSMHGNAPLNTVITKTSCLIAKSIFGANELHMFSEGLAQEIEKSIYEAIDKYHRKVR